MDAVADGGGAAATGAGKGGVGGDGEHASKASLAEAMAAIED